MLGSASTVLFDGVEAVRGKGEAATYRQNQQEALSKLNQSYTDFTSSSLISKTPDKKGKVTTEQVDGVEKFYNEVEGGEKQEITPQAADRIKVQNNADGAGNYVVPGQYPVENGQVVKDLKKSADFAEAAKIHSELDDLIELETSKSKKDNYKIQLYQLAKLSQLATTAFTTGTTDFLMQKLDTYKKMSPEQLQAAGIEDPKTIDTQVDI